MSIILCGPPLCGKTTLGKFLAKKLQWPFIDTDDLIEKNYLIQMKTKLSRRDIYKLHGEDTFRLLEKEAITSLSPKNPSVIATGGGCLISDENTSHLKSLGMLVYLKTSVETLWKRLDQKQMPAYLCEKDPRVSFEKILKSREPLYEKAADYTLDTTSMHDDDMILTLLRRLHG